MVGAKFNWRYITVDNSSSALKYTGELQSLTNISGNRDIAKRRSFICLDTKEDN
jgi:hypothetical protein